MISNNTHTFIIYLISIVCGSAIDSTASERLQLSMHQYASTTYIVKFESVHFSHIYFESKLIDFAGISTIRFISYIGIRMHNI